MTYLKQNERLNHYGLILLPLIIFFVYQNTFNASWHFDDYHNIVDNPRLHLKQLTQENIGKTFCASYDHGYYKSPQIYRPLTNLTFALNWFAGQDNVFGYHVINLAIHSLCAIFLFLTILSLFHTPRLKEADRKDTHLIAFLTTLLWALHPIQTQAVTYVVQRAAALSALFYISGLFFFLKGRLLSQRHSSFWFFAASFCSFLLALASKQNSVTFPIALFLIEATFFLDLSHPKIKKAMSIFLPILLMVVILFSAALFMKGNPFSFLNGYDNRPFSLTERLLTEPRIIIFYLSLLFFPLAQRLSFFHDIEKSTSLLNPITTLPAILLIGVLIVLAFLYLRKYPLFSFAVLFFFLNHIIESSIIPLELFYEHRNYLPSFFLFLPIVSLCQKCLHRYRTDRRMALLIIGISGGILFMGFQTYQRNQIYKNEKVFWEDAIQKAPGLARPYHNLAMYHFDKIGDTQTAFKLYNIALTKKYPDRNDAKANTYNNLGNIFASQKMFKEADAMYQQALELHPQYDMAKVNRTINYLYMQKFIEASHLMDGLLQKKPKDPAYLDLKGLILLRRNHIDDAISFFERALSQNPNFNRALFNMGTALYLKKQYSEADRYLNQALILTPNDINIHLRRLENAIHENNEQNRRSVLKILLDKFPLQQIKERIMAETVYDITYPLDRPLLLIAFKEALPGDFQF